MVLTETVRSFAAHIASFITILRDIDAIIRHQQYQAKLYDLREFVNILPGHVLLFE